MMPSRGRREGGRGHLTTALGLVPRACDMEYSRYYIFYSSTEEDVCSFHDDYTPYITTGLFVLS